MVSSILFPVSQNDLAALKEQWMELVAHYTSDTTLKETLFQTIYEKYSEKNRFYHNLSHVQALLNLYASLQDKIENPDAVQFSIWFHDAVYNTERNDNEEESARFASEVLGDLQVHSETADLVQTLILATKNHRGTDLSDDTKRFLDMDLAILGMPEEIYEKYNRAIRQEYSWVPEPAYRQGRSKVLQSFINRERIYFTDDMQARFEKQARKNVHGELKVLGS